MSEGHAATSSTVVATCVCACGISACTTTRTVTTEMLSCRCAYVHPPTGHNTNLGENTSLVHVPAYETRELTYATGRCMRRDSP